jgi:hypothetical protein
LASLNRGALLAVILGMVLACLGLVVARALVPHVELSHVDANVAVAGYVATIATVYAVLLAFVVFVVWGQLNEARRMVEGEGNELENMLRLTQAIDEPHRTQARTALLAYAEAIVREEWSASKAAQDQRPEELEPSLGSLDALWATMTQIEPKNYAQEVVYEQILGRFDELTELRSKRLLMDQQRMHPIMWVLLIGGTLFTVGSMSFFQLESAWLHAILSALVGGVLAFVLYLIYDLDDPFHGIWQVEVEPIRRVLRMAARSPEPQSAQSV